MQDLRASLPPMNSLVAFEAAARHLSFTRAAQELRVSREAVSRQMRILESHLGAALFIRQHRALDLTPAGQALEAVVRQGLQEIARTADDLRRAGRRAKVTVTATIAISSYWLTPRLPKFRAAQPEAEIRVVVSDSPVDMLADGIDVGLRYGDGKWPGVRSVHLFDVESFPVCTPSYLRGSPPIETPADLLGHTLLNLDGAPHALEDWAWWLKGTGVRAPAAFQILGFDSYANVIQAALEGQGIALGFAGIIDDLLSGGQLVRPLSAALSKGGAVYLVVPAGARLAPVAQDFFDWVIAEAALQTGRDATPAG